MKAVNSALVIGGLGSTIRSMEPFCEALSSYYDDVDGLSLRSAWQDDRLAQKIKGRPIVTHSAGAVVLEKTLRIGRIAPSEVVSFGAPYGRSALGLVLSSTPKSYHLLMRNRQDGDKPIVRTYQWETGKEIVAHPKITLDVVRDIAQHNAFDAAIWMADNGITSKLVWNHDDDYFTPERSALTVADNHPLIDIHLLAGEHDEPLVRPHNVLPYVF